MIQRLSLVSIGLATGALVSGYALGDLWAWTLPAIVLGLFWLVGQWRGWGWVPSVGLAFSTSLAAAGLLLQVGAGWMLFAVVAALTAWDLGHYAHWLGSVQRVEKARELERRHLQRLLIVDSLGLLLAAAALQLRAKLSFGVAVVLGLLVILGVSRAVGLLRGDSN
jgi:hypothetical protein